MLFEVFFRVVQVALCLGGQHIHFLAHRNQQSCNEIITTWLPGISLDEGMRAMLNRLFSWHALRLTFVRDFADENCPRSGGYAPEVCPISIRNLADSCPNFYGR